MPNIELMAIIFNLLEALSDLALWLIEHWPLAMLLL